jgi:hypothetical protein
MHYRDRVKVLSVSTGTGDFVLGAALPSSISFVQAGVVDGEPVDYTIQNDAVDEWEVGSGTYNATPNSITRGNITRSSNANALVNFSGGNKTVVFTLSERMMNKLSNLSGGPGPLGIAGATGEPTVLAGVYMRWVPYTGPPQSFLNRDLTRDGDWTMVANKNTSDRPSPQASGAEEDLLPAWTPATTSAPATYTVYNEWTVNSAGWVDQYGGDVLTQNTNFAHTITLSINGVVKDTFTSTPVNIGLYWHNITPLLVAIGAVIRVTVKVTQPTTGNPQVYWLSQTGLFATAPTYCSLAVGSKDGAAAGTTAYGCHLQFIPGTYSPDWDVVAFGGAAAGGGGGGGGGAPVGAVYLVQTADATLTNERVVTDSTTIVGNWGTAGQVSFFIPANAVDNGIAADMPDGTIKARPLGSGPGNPVDLTGTNVVPILPNFVASGASHARGIVPDPGATVGTTRYLREDATWAAPPSGGGGGSTLTTYFFPYTGAGATVAIPSGATEYEIVAQAGGGGGGGGRVAAAATARWGGSGGGGGGWVRVRGAVADLGGATVLYYYVGQGGGGGGMQGASSDGIAGSAGQASYVQITNGSGRYLAWANGGYGGLGGSTAAVAAAAGGEGMNDGGGGGSANGQASSVTAGGNGRMAAGGGGGGGSMTTSNTYVTGSGGGSCLMGQNGGGAVGANSGGTQNGVAGGPGTNALASSPLMGGGGGGGGGSGAAGVTTYSPGPGGAGGLYGGGGGGGGSGVNGTAYNGAGGSGGNGAVYICFR